MASTSASAAATPQSQVTALRMKLYEEALESIKDLDGDVMTQDDILGLQIEGLETIERAMPVLQRLCDEKYMRVMQLAQGGLAWQVRSKEEAKRYRSFTPEQETVYSHIEDAGQDGLWSKTIRAKTNLHEAVFNQTIKWLVSKSYITDMKSVEHPTRKMYIKSTLRPSDRTTGGPWYTDGELDEEFVGQVIVLLKNIIVGRTFYKAKSPKKPKKVIGGKKMTPEEAAAVRANGLGPLRGKGESEQRSQSQAKDARLERKAQLASYLPMPTTYRGYPDLDELTLLVENSGLLTSAVVLTSGDIQQLLDVMIYDGNISKIIAGDTVAYRAQRKALMEDEELGNVLTEVPCGRCPVFDLCEEGGPVGPSNCEYFNEWLSL